MNKFLPVIVIHIIFSFLAGLNAIAADSDEERVKSIKTTTMYQFDGESKEREVGGPKAACQLYIQDTCKINDCSDRNWKLDGDAKVKGTYVYCDYTGDNGLVMDSSPASIKLICPENAESSWDGEALYCKCIPDFVESAGACVAKVHTAEESPKQEALEESPASPAAKSGNIEKPSDITKPRGETTAQSDARHAAETEQFANDGGKVKFEKDGQWHHIASNKSPTYTPILRKILAGAGLDIDKADENLVWVTNHGGSHERTGYHKEIINRFEKALTSDGKQLESGTPEYVVAVNGVLAAAGADLVRPGSKLNEMVTKKN